MEITVIGIDTMAPPWQGKARVFYGGFQHGHLFISITRSFSCYSLSIIHPPPFPGNSTFRFIRFLMILSIHGSIKYHCPLRIYLVVPESIIYVQIQLDALWMFAILWSRSECWVSFGISTSAVGFSSGHLWLRYSTPQELLNY